MDIVTLQAARAAAKRDGDAAYLRNEQLNDVNSSARVFFDSTYAPVGDVAYLKTNAVVTIFHGANAATSRPIGAPRVLWIGSVTPNNILAGDLYAPSTTTPAVPAWTPASLTNLGAWYDPSSLSALASGASVTSWADKSSNARNLSNSGTAPTYSPTAYANNPAINFDGSTTGYMVTPAFTTTGTSSVSMWCNFTVTDASAIRTLLSAGDSTSAFSVVTRTSGAGIAVYRGSATAISLNSPLSVNTPYSLGVVVIGTALTVYLNGTSIGTGTVTNVDMTTLRIGRRADGSSRHWGLIGDVFWKTGDPSSDEITKVNAYLAARRGA